MQEKQRFVTSFEKRFVAPYEAPFIHLYACERGIFISGTGSPHPVSEIREMIEKCKENIETEESRINWLESAI